MANRLGSEFELAGHFGVDAGVAWLGDPCYIIHRNEGKLPNSLGKNWGDFCDSLYKGSFEKNGFKSFEYDMGHEGLGVLVQTGYGDGKYPVYVRKDSNGRVVEVKILFDEAEDEY